jgi:hypothetical protein
MSIVPFPQTGMTLKASFQPWKSSSRSQLATTGTRLHGFVGASMEAPEYTVFQARFAPLAPFVPFVLLVMPDPDFRIAYPLNVPPLGAEAQRSLDAIHLHAYNRAILNYDKEQEAYMGVRARLIASISPAVACIVGHPIDGFAGMSIQAIFAAMTAHYGLFTADELAALERTLDEVWTAGTIEDHVAKHTATHETLRSNGAPISTPAKIQRLTQSLSALPITDHDHPFRIEVINYRDANPNLALQVFAGFAAGIVRAGFGILPVPHSAISAAKKKSAFDPKSDASLRRRFHVDAPDVHCSHHGPNKTHDTAHCKYMARAAGRGAGGGSAK